MIEMQMVDVPKQGMLIFRKNILPVSGVRTKCLMSQNRACLFSEKIFYRFRGMQPPIMAQIGPNLQNIYADVPKSGILVFRKNILPVFGDQTKSMCFIACTIMTRIMLTKFIKNFVAEFRRIVIIVIIFVII